MPAAASNRLDAADISAAEAVSVANIAMERGFRFDRKGNHAGPCPKCGGRDRFSISIRKGAFLCRQCFPKGGGGAIRLVMFLDNVGFREAVETLIGNNDIPVATSKNILIPARNSADDERNQRFALELWREADRADATPVAIYLTRRGLYPPSPDVIRFHPCCPFGQDANGRTITTPAMLALVRNIVSNEPQAIHRTALDGCGNKIEFIGQDGKPRSRMALGSIHGGAVKLTDDAGVTKAVGIGEGIETSLSLQQLPEWFSSPVWSLLSKNGVRDFPVLSGVETLMVGVDHDVKQDGQKAATAVAARWRAVGREVLLAWPSSPGDDINDVVRERAP
jgi:phage/plasmid primase-like uncharacterized protein